VNRTRVPAGGTTALGRDVPTDRSLTSRRELLVGVVLLAAVVVGGVYVAARPAPGAVDVWLQQVIPGSTSRAVTAVTALRYPWCIVIGSIVAAAVTVRRDRTRAVACLVGPPLALLLCELVVKPAVGRTLGGSLTYPSGSTAGAAALAVAAVLATPERLRAVAVAVAGLYALGMAVAVVALRWHFPTDAAAGLAWGVGVVLVADAAAWWAARRWAGRSRGLRGVDPEPVTPSSA
jgi:membrane-associated phospholipid phosphatase